MHYFFFSWQETPQESHSLVVHVSTKIGPTFAYSWPDSQLWGQISKSCPLISHFGQGLIQFLSPSFCQQLSCCHSDAPCIARAFALPFLPPQFIFQAFTDLFHYNSTSNFILAKGLLCQFLQDEMQNVLASTQLLKLFKREAPIHVLAIFLTLPTSIAPPKKNNHFSKSFIKSSCLWYAWNALSIFTRNKFLPIITCYACGGAFQGCPPTAVGDDRKSPSPF